MDYLYLLQTLFILPLSVFYLFLAESMDSEENSAQMEDKAF